MKLKFKSIDLLEGIVILSSGNVIEKDVTFLLLLNFITLPCHTFIFSIFNCLSPIFFPNQELNLGFKEFEFLYTNRSSASIRSYYLQIPDNNR